jgi:hypothetical protein
MAFKCVGTADGFKAPSVSSKASLSYVTRCRRWNRTDVSGKFIFLCNGGFKKPLTCNIQVMYGLHGKVDFIGAGIVSSAAMLTAPGI